MARMRLTNGRLIDNSIPYDTELYEKIISAKFSQEDRLIIDVIVRYTLGYGLPDDPNTRLSDKALSYRYLAKSTGIPKSTVKRRVDALVSRNILLKGWEYLWLKDKNGVQQRRRTTKLGINYEFWQWDKKGDFIEHTEYLKLCERAKEFVREYLEIRNPELKLITAKKRDKVHFKIMKRGHHLHNAIVIPLTSWDGVSKVKVKITDPQPNTFYFYVNKEVTRFFEVAPNKIKEQTVKVARPTIESKYVEIPKEDIRLIVGNRNNHFETNPEGNPRNEVKGIATPLSTH